YADTTFMVPLGIEEPAAYEIPEQLEFNVYPNPASEFAGVSVIIENRTDIEVNLFDLNGRLIESKHIANCFSGKHEVKLDVRGVRNGTYIIQVIANGISGTEKVIIK
ncbi:MAG: T9SS type A sorting domain-containing protein, partial [Bacteroidales bacterium]|nr:T9SS type A sorting domain-containing protein [Bacteroidales bacterium]